MGDGEKQTNSYVEPKEEINIDTLEHKRDGGVHNWCGGSTHNNSLGVGDGYHCQVLLQAGSYGEKN